MSIEDHFKLIVGHGFTEIVYIGRETASVLSEARSTNLKRELGCSRCKARKELGFKVPKLIVDIATPAEISRCPSLKREVAITDCPVLRSISRKDNKLLPLANCSTRLRRSL
jgi:hypothetical protein